MSKGRYRQYSEYKDSCVEWLGDIPAHWDVGPFKRQIERNDGGVWGNDPDGTNGTIVLRSTEQTVDGHWQLDDPAPRKLTKGEIEGALLLEGDLLLTKSSGSSLHIGKTTLVTAEVASLRCCYSNFMQRIRTKPDFLPKLAWYVLNNELARRQFDLLSNSTTGLANLNATMVGQLLVICPPLPEQTQIAKFLDHETAKIDRLIEKQEALIRLLKEKRQAVISHAVTKGLNPHAPLKDSGIPWLGQVPTHWSFGPLKRFWDVIDCKHVTVPFTESGFRVASIMEVRNFELNLTDALRTPEEFYRVMVAGGREPQRGDIIYCRNTANTGTSAYVDTDERFAMGQDVVLIKSRNRNGRYLNYFLHGDSMSKQLDTLMVGSTFKRINVADIRMLSVPCPPSKEQDEIVDFIDREAPKVDRLIGNAEHSAALLQERRTALISAAVTGKIDVRDWQPPVAA